MSTVRCLFWNANDSMVKLMVSVTSTVSFWYRLCYKKYLKLRQRQQIQKKLRQYKTRFSLTVKQILDFSASTYLFRKIRNLPTNFKGIA